MKPTIGRIVHYQTDERAGMRYKLPAIIVGTADNHAGSEYPDGTPNPLPVPTEGTVHLVVFTPGPGSTYTELSVPFDDSDYPAPRSWSWPVRSAS